LLSLGISIAGGLIGGFVISFGFFRQPEHYYTDELYWDLTHDFGEKKPLLESSKYEKNI